MSTSVYIMGRDITAPFVIAPVVVVVYKCPDGFLQFTGLHCFIPFEAHILSPLNELFLATGKLVNLEVFRHAYVVIVQIFPVICAKGY